MYQWIALSVACLIAVSGCSTTPCQTLPDPKPPIPEANLAPALDLPVNVETGTLQEAGVLLIFVSGKYYELQSRFHDLVKMVRERQKAE